jgi:Protein of unknown function (DUF4238)
VPDVSEPIRHHYIPIFYLKQWTGTDGRLCEYSRPYKTVKAKRKYPAATGYVDGLYALPDAPPGGQQVIEKRLMGHVDDLAARAVKVLLKNDPNAARWDAAVAIGWGQFLYSLIVRNPEHLVRIQKKLGEMSPDIIEQLREDYPQLREPGDPPTFEEYKAQFVLKPSTIPAPYVLPHLIGSKRMAREITSFLWETRSVNTAKHSMLTSDRPVIMTNGLNQPDAHIALPISPRLLFIASRNQETSNRFRVTPSDELVQMVNNKVAEQAIKYVYGTNDSQLRFVANRLGKKIQSSPLG